MRPGWEVTEERRWKRKGVRVELCRGVSTYRQRTSFGTSLFIGVRSGTGCSGMCTNGEHRKTGIEGVEKGKGVTGGMTNETKVVGT